MKSDSDKPLLLTGGRVFGGSGWTPPKWYEAVLVYGDRIVKVGDYRELSANVSVKTVIDLEGALLLPGLGDAHLHMSAGGKSLEWADIGGLNRDEASEVLLAAEGFTDADDNRWVIAFNWDPSINRIDRAFLDRLLPGKLTLINQRDLHGGCCCSELLRIAGFTSDSEDPDGGRIGRDEDGQLTGQLFESAIRKVWDNVPEGNPELRRRFIISAQQYLLKLGLIAVGEVLNDKDELIYQELDRNGELVLRVDAWRRIENWNGEPPSPSGKKLTVRTLKIFLDGSFGSSTAALDEPYLDDPHNSGVLFYDDRELSESLESALIAGWRLALHAIGNRAVRQALRVISALPVNHQGRIRIEHIQLLSQEQVQEAASLGIIASIQPVHLLADQNWLSGKIGESVCRDAFRWQSFLAAGVPLALGSDWPVASPDPLLNLHIAVNRCGFGKQSLPCFTGEENLSPYQAVRAATYGWAVAANMERQCGMIMPGYEANFTIVDGISPDMQDWSQGSIKGSIAGGVLVEV